jgi:hypothetical protein
MRRMPDDSIKPLIGQPLAIDPSAESASAAEPAFIAPPAGAPVYYGFLVLHDVVIEGFTLGKITDFEAQPSSYGDAFVIAPDGFRAGLVWEVLESAYFQEVRPPEPERWGVWGVSFPFTMDSRENAQRNLEFILPHLKEKWQEWQTMFRRKD